MTTYCLNHCPDSGALSWVSTGIFSGLSHLSGLNPHTGSRPNKQTNGIFFWGQDLDCYQDYMRQFHAPDMLRYQPDGRIEGYRVFSADFGYIEQFGSYVCDSSTGMAVLLNRPDNSHGYPYRHTGATLRCQVCGSGLDDVRNPAKAAWPPP